MILEHVFDVFSALVGRFELISLALRLAFQGKNLPTRIDEVVDVSEKGVDLGVMRK